MTISFYRFEMCSNPCATIHLVRSVYVLVQFTKSCLRISLIFNVFYCR
ncbi:hypothetical protein PBCV1_a086bL [Paramecium bursaria Chlorella virus 1]|uniref:Uncharacterized protein n=1 Tax=Paramecium bursaria Chlorella virus 1 TaxID=10506 RepID=F8TTX4_PBCV1|nr:hypothetical protein PBCV1_a086bL [Paramecium bursaria Chlorella virus 1]AEI70035.1 hypothetical protein [Paramecium bursaria Chlorella virus 1]